MKSLKSLNFGANELLQRNQLKSIIGGEGDTLTQAGSGGGGGSSVCSVFECNNQFDCDIRTESMF